MPNSKVTLQDIANDLLRVSIETKIPVHELTKRMYEDGGGKYSGKAIDKRGGISRVKSLLPDTEKELADIDALKRVKTYTTRLEGLVGSKLNLEEQVKEVIKTLNLKITLPKAPKFKKDTSDRVQNVAVLNDTHIGNIVRREENNNTNNFDFLEAGRRVALYVLQAAEYKKYKRGQVEKLHLILNGDLLHGLIHGITTQSQHLITLQMNATLHIFAHAIIFLSQHYNEIDIHCIPGNHERMPHKENGKRPTSENWDSYTNIAFYAMSAIFAKESRLKFFAPKTSYGFIDLPAGRLMYTHGETMFSKALGNVGKSINVEKLTNDIRDFNAGEIAKGNKPIKMLLLAHVHVYGHFVTKDGVEVVVVSSLIGADGFSHVVLGQNHSMTAQILFESTKDFIFGDSRLIRLGKADNDSSLDSIIPTYKRELTWQK